MEPVNIHITTNTRFVKVFTALVKLFGGEYSIETIRQKRLESVIRKGEADLAAGKGTVLTIDELRAMNNEAARS